MVMMMKEVVGWGLPTPATLDYLEELVVRKTGKFTASTEECESGSGQKAIEEEANETRTGLIQ